MMLNKERVLIVGNPKSVRVNIRKILADLGFQSNQIMIVDKFVDAARMISDDRPEVLITSNFIEGHTLNELYLKHIEYVPNRVKSFFCLVLEGEWARTSDLLKYDIDLVISRPFTADEFKTHFETAYKEKQNPSEINKLSFSIQSLLASGDNDVARKVLIKLSEQHPESPFIAYYLANLILDEDEGRAIGILEEAYAQNAKNLKIKTLLADLYFERGDYENAKQLSDELLNEFPINPSKISQYIKMAIMGRHYDDIRRYALLVKELPDYDIETLREVAAGLVIGASHLISLSKFNEASECLLVAERYASEFTSVFQKIIQSYFQIGEYERGEILLERLIKSGDSSAETRILKLQIFYFKQDYIKAMSEANLLIKDNVIDERVFELAISSSIYIGRRTESINMLIQDAMVHFPKLQRYMDKL